MVDGATSNSKKVDSNDLLFLEDRRPLSFHSILPFDLQHHKRKTAILFSAAGVQTYDLPHPS